jgi:hypothetical protein
MRKPTPKAIRPSARINARIDLLRRSRNVALGNLMW